jgi:hypothetical protein
MSARLRWPVGQEERRAGRCRYFGLGAPQVGQGSSSQGQPHSGQAIELTFLVAG